MLLAEFHDIGSQANAALHFSAERGWTACFWLVGHRSLKSTRIAKHESTANVIVSQRPSRSHETPIRTSVNDDFRATSWIGIACHFLLTIQELSRKNLRVSLECFWKLTAIQTAISAIANYSFCDGGVIDFRHGYSFLYAETTPLIPCAITVAIFFVVYRPISIPLAESTTHTVFFVAVFIVLFLAGVCVAFD